MTDAVTSRASGGQLPVVALVGRPNVGKSTLFNALTRTRDALVADLPGLTRDRQYGFGVVGPRPYIVVDTGGLTDAAEGIDALARQQTLQALSEAQTVLFLVDARSGLTPADQIVAEMLRRQRLPVTVVLNKAEGLDRGVAGAEFHALGLGQPWAISAAHGQGISGLMARVFEGLESPDTVDGTAAADQPKDDQGIRVAVIGRPNVGKSTLINRILGEERVLAFDQPGTTRDSVFIPFERDGQVYTLIDTAGVRRRARVRDYVEKFSIVKTMQAIEAAHVVIFITDAQTDIGAQDARLLGLVAERGRGLVLAVNKWDGLTEDDRQRVRRELDLKLSFVDYARLHRISALHGTGVGNLFDSVRQAYDSAMREMPTPQLTRVLEEAVAGHPPPAVHGRRIKLRYAHQGGRNPPTIVIHGNQTRHLTPDYKRYLVHRFRRAFGLTGTPVQLEFRTGQNPFEGRRNTLTPRQQRKRERVRRRK